MPSNSMPRVSKAVVASVAPVGSALKGGAVHISGGTAVFSGCTLTSNEAWDGGGALYVAFGSTTLTRTLLRDNLNRHGLESVFIEDGAEWNEPETQRRGASMRVAQSRRR